VSKFERALRELGAIALVVLILFGMMRCAVEVADPGVCAGDERGVE
jgi:hypothetical protein